MKSKFPLPRTTTVKRENLANLLQIPRKYRLVNETSDPMTTSLGVEPKFAPVDPEDDYTKDQLIFAIGSALPEIATFVQEMDIMRADHAASCNAVANMHFAAVGSYREPIRGVVEDVAHLRSRFNQAMDVLKNIAHNLDSANIMRASASSFLDTIRKDEESEAGNVVIPMNALVNEKVNNSSENHSGTET